MTMPVLQRVPIDTVKTNPSNPRTIRDERFHKLVQSIKDFPEMLELRPIVTDADRVVLGGNMRLKACKAAGLKTVPIVIAEHLTDAQRREFVVKDNVGFGDWDWDLLANDFDLPELQAWGFAELELPQFGATANASPTSREQDISGMGHTADVYLNNTIRQIVLHYDRETHADVLDRLKTVGVQAGCGDDNALCVIALLEYWENQRGAGA
jgi:hypothetical protein